MPPPRVDHLALTALNFFNRTVVNTPDAAGQSALHHAVSNPSKEPASAAAADRTVKILLENGVRHIPSTHSSFSVLSVLSVSSVASVSSVVSSLTAPTV